MFPVGQGVYRAQIQPGWDIFGVSNGGYTLSTAARAMGAEAMGRSLASVGARYLNPAAAEAVTIEVEVLKEGRSTSTLEAKMISGDRAIFISSATFAVMADNADEVVRNHGSPPQLPPVEECVRLTPAGESPLPPPFTGKVGVYLHPDDLNLGTGTPGRMPEMRGWFRLLDGEPIDPYGLVVAADAFPPAVFNSDLPVGWTPTIDLTVHVRHPGPFDLLACRFLTRYVTGGWLEEDGEMWDTSGRLVAQSRQLAMLARQG